MKIEDLVLSIEQMNHLKELGVEVKDTAMAWFPPYKYDADGFPSYLFRDKDSYSVAFNDGDDAAIPTLTLQEILEMLPKKIEINSREYYLFINYQDVEVSYAISDDEMFYTNMFEDIWPNTLQAAYNMLCWCAENGYLNKE